MRKLDWRDVMELVMFGLMLLALIAYFKGGGKYGITPNKYANRPGYLHNASRDMLMEDKQKERENDLGPLREEREE